LFRLAKVRRLILPGDIELNSVQVRGGHAASLRESRLAPQVSILPGKGHNRKWCAKWQRHPAAGLAGRGYGFDRLTAVRSPKGKSPLLHTKQMRLFFECRAVPIRLN